MSTSVVPGQLVTAKDATALAQEAAARLAESLRAAIAARGSVSFALSGGNTPRPVYERLARETGIAWDKVSIFFIDERAVPPTSDRSNYRLAKESLLDGAPIPAGNVHRMRGEAENLEEAAREYEAVLRQKLSGSTVEAREVPTFDVALLGIGDDGHTASLFPGDSTINVRDRLVLPVAASPEHKREARLTVTVPVIEHIERVLVLVAGKEKHPALERIWSVQGTTHETPGRILRDAKGSVVWCIDKAAGGAQ